MKSTSGIALVTLLIYLAIGGTAATWALKPELIPGTAAHRAKKATLATAQLTAATQKVDDSAQHQAAQAAASLSVIGQANAEAPDSPAKNFIAKEVPLALSFLPAADPMGLRAASERKLAEMSGQLSESRRLYEQAYKDSARLQSERDKALAERDLARRERERIDADYREAAAAEHARTMQFAAAAIVAFLALAAWGYARLYSITPKSLGAMAADIRAGENPIVALDRFTPTWMHRHVNQAAKLASEFPESAASKTNP